MTQANQRVSYLYMTECMLLVDCYPVLIQQKAEFCIERDRWYHYEMREAFDISVCQVTTRMV